MIAEAQRRDDGAHKWDRPELFLEKRHILSSNHAALSGFDDLLDAQASFGTPGQPTAREEAAFLLQAWRSEAAMLLRGTAPKKARANLLQFLWQRASWVSETHEGLRKKITRKFKCCELHGSQVALLDGRAARAGEERAAAIPSEYRDQLIYTAAKRGGRVAQGVDDLLAEAEQLGLPAEFVELLLTMRGPGSQVNRRLMDSVKPEVDALQPYFRGKKSIDDVTASLRRCYDKLHSMTVVTADDFTLNAYFSVPDGNGWFTLTRGQVLLFIDVRSQKIIGRALVPERNYDALQIRSGMNTVCREHGIPSVWLFERGIWKRSHIVKGTAPKEWKTARSGEEFKFDWENLGSKFIHATRARSKPAEGVGGLLQNLMDGCRGACGRDERRDCPEETKRAKLAVEARREHPDKFFDTFDQWEARLDQFIERYNTRKQHGRLAGKTPDEEFEARWPHNDPPTRLDSQSWHLGAHWVREMEVGRDGIAFRHGKHSFAYFDESISDMRGRSVLVWFDPEMPDMIAVTDLDKKNCRVVSRHTPIDFLAAHAPYDSAEATHYRGELAKQHGFNSYPKARYKALKAKFEPSFRQVVPSRQTAALAAEMRSQRTDAAAQNDTEGKRRDRIMRLCRETETPPATLNDFSEETEQTLQRRARRRRASAAPTL
jgi:hypothetical protein